MQRRNFPSFIPEFSVCQVEAVADFKAMVFVELTLFSSQKGYNALAPPITLTGNGLNPA